ncbi:GvpL/GvpF family gas vesicle protein [Streptomyces sp. NPDC088785]|uniref:GvpL/GvpF family gas vesicle protein n=1 Tax=Streptomyces sp. NPDC088785 TaxID=3365897 RepID=UPI0037F12A9E
MPAPPARSSLYVYALTDPATAGHARRCPAVGDQGASVTVLVQDDLAAVVSPAAERPRARRRDLRAHQDVLNALLAHGPVLPMRFGMIAADEEAVRADMSARRAQNLSALARVAGRAEWNVKGESVPEALPELLREDAGLRALRASTRQRPGYEADVRLGQAIAAALQRRAEAAARDVVAHLDALAVDVRVGGAVAGGALNSSFLVAQSDEAPFRRAVQALAERHRGRIALTVTGPLPCYSFVGGDAVPAGQ